MTAQILWHRNGHFRQQGLAHELGIGGKQWSSRLQALTKGGIQAKHLIMWAWILEGDKADTRLTRFLSTTELHKPIFLLFLMVRSDQTFHDRQSFTALLEYIKETYTSVPVGEDGRPIARKEHRSLDSVLNMTPELFIKLLGRLQFHASRLYPESVVKLAELSTAYIQSRSVLETGSENWTSTGPGYADRCFVLNRALCILSKPAKSRPFASMEHNWDAQKHILAFSSSLARPLIINEAGYRAIQRVMIGREKSAGEDKVAVRSTKNWPPYRRAWDGIDEQRRPEDDLSRAVKAGIQAREAGYPETELDRALGALGGAVLGQSPSVQTRSLPPVVRTGTHAAEAALTTWAARIRATRNAQEAWAIFQSPPLLGGRKLKPSSVVYGAVMAKLVAGDVPDPSSAVPGSQKENFPVYQSPNLSEFEKARIRPPTLELLAEQMINSGVKPVGSTLALLIGSSNSEHEALQWLRSSQIYTRFADVLDSSSTTRQQNPKLLGRLPRSIFNAYIGFLCKMQRHEDVAVASEQGSSKPPDHYLKLAIHLTAARLNPERYEGSTYKPPWLQVLRTVILAKTHASLRRSAVRRTRLTLFTDLFSWVVKQTGIDSALLGLLSLSAGRVMTAIFTSGNQDQSEGMSSEIGWEEAQDVHIDHTSKHLLQGLHQQLLKAFNEMKQSGSGIDGFHVYSYVRIMGLFGDVNAMAEAVDWALSWVENGETLGGAVTAGTSSNAYLNLALELFDTIAPGKIDGEMIQSIKTRRQVLVERRYPVDVPELARRYLDDVALVGIVSRGWRRVSEE